MSQELDQMRVRREKMDELKAAGIEPFGRRYHRDHLAQDLHEQFDQVDKDELLEQENMVSIAGRMMRKRSSGKAGFADFVDRTGKIQVYARKDMVGDEQYHIFKRADLGDFMGIKGDVIKTNTGELTIRAREITFLSKALRPLPNKWEGVKDPETIYRQRYLDLIANPESFKRFHQRTAIIKAIRKYMDDHGFTEVETPILNTQAGGANARPFITHHNALNIDMYLRIATELYLKRLIVGGFERVYELGRVFRNEGMDLQHNPEFTTIETYAAYWDLWDVMDETEGIIKAAAKVVSDDGKITYQGTEIDLGGEFKRITMNDAVKEQTGIDFKEIKTDEEARQLAAEKHVKYEKWWSKGHILSAFFDEFVEDTLIQPTFIYEFPVEVSPLAKRNQENPEMADRFELYIAGGEMGNAFSELNDPLDQKYRFEMQAKEKANGNDEAEPVDLDYVEALEYGMPPTGGLGIGIDRLVMLLTDAKSIRDVILFPTMRPEKTADGEEEK